ncbi:hypothetical protein CVT24_010839 [Panaeolus cyanescens]|uniref:Putative ER transporter 6TM N-terminal domain-containing protein n=1 Tax=Panaeolus cyanescens TaxID=181874 RepID=A0A409YYE3_9AGAR|nr:hypothetical protein CVT24_010839 [Panaeolus cyanescens]
MVHMHANYLKEFQSKVYSRQVQKLCIRAVVVFIAMMVLTLDDRTANVLGPANIFALALAVVIPPFLPASLYVMITSAFIILLLSCWACANLIIAVANAARSPKLLVQELSSAESSFVPGLPIEAQNAQLIFSGHYLDPRSSVVTGVLLFVFTWAYGLLLAHVQALIVIIFFALTLLSSVTIINPLVPQAVYTSSLTFLISSACYLALCLGSYVLVFPRSFNASWLVGIRREVLGPAIRLLDPPTDNQPDSEQLAAHSPHPRTSDVSASKLKASLSNVESMKFTFNTEFSIHRLAPAEHVELLGLFGKLVGRLGELEVGQMSVNALQSGVPSDANEHTHEVEKEHPPLPNAIRAIIKASDTLCIALQIALMDIDEWVKECNMDSWGDVFRALVMNIRCIPLANKYRVAAAKKADYRRVRLEISRSNLRAAMGKFRKEDIKAILSTLRNQAQAVEGETHQQTRLQERETLVLMTHLNALNQLGKTIVEFLAFLIQIEVREPHPTVRFPPALLNLFRPKTANDEGRPRQDVESQPDSPTSTREKGKYKRTSGVESPIASSVDHSEGVHVAFSSTITSDEGLGMNTSPSPVPSQEKSNIQPSPGLPLSPKKARVQVQKRNRFWVWITSNEMIFALRMAVVTIALWIPVVCQSTTHLFVANFGIFAMVLGQSYVSVYAGQQIFMFLLRFLGTFIGVLLTAAGWYISAAGDSRGNGYALVVITTILVFPSIFVMTSGSGKITMVFWVTMTATVATMTALIWADVRRAPGGTDLARLVFDDLWKRLVLDLIGAAGAFVVMFIPKPITMRRGFHEKLSSLLIRLAVALHHNPDENTKSEAESVKILLASSLFDFLVFGVAEQQKLLTVSDHYIQNMELLDDTIKADIRHRLIMVPDILSTCHEELLYDSHAMENVSPLRISASTINDSGPLEVPVNISNIQSIIFASAALNLHEILTIIAALRDGQNQRKFIRAFVVLAAALTLILNDVTSEKIGSAGLLLGALSCVLPPFLPFSAHFVMMMLLVFWVLVSWGWICAAQLVAFAVRDKALLAQRLQEAQDIYDPGLSLAAQAQQLIYSGHYLDSRASIAFGVFLFVGTFTAALIVKLRPAMTFHLLFGLILLSSYITIGPVLPIPTYQSPETVIHSIGTYAVISLVSIAFIFPQSLNQSWLFSVQRDVLQPMIKFLDTPADISHLSTVPSISHLLLVFHGYERTKSLFSTEFTVNRLSTPLFLEVYARIKQLVYRISALEMSQSRMAGILRYETRGTIMTDGHHSNFYEEILSRSDALRSACRISLMDVEEWIREWAADSWIDVIRSVDRGKIDYRRVRLEISRSNLRKTRMAFRKEQLADLMLYFKQSAQSAEEPTSLRNDRNCATVLSFLANLDFMENELFALLSFLVEIEHREPKPIPRLPACFTRVPRPKGEFEPALRYLDHAEPRVPTSVSKELPLPPTLENVSSSGFSRLSLLKNARGEHNKTIKAVKNALRSPTFFYAAKLSVVALILWIPVVFQPVTNIYLTTSGFMALILGTSYVDVYAGDQAPLFKQLLMKKIPQVGAASWFIGARKTGQPYTFIASTVCEFTCSGTALMRKQTVLSAPALFISVASTNPTWLLFSALISSTIVGSIDVIWNDGIVEGGVSTALVWKNIWQRGLLDLIGFVVSAVVMMLPMPYTSRRGFHEKLSQSLLDVRIALQNEHANLLLSSPPGVGTSKLQEFHAIAGRHVELEQFLTSMKFDPRIRNLPSNIYGKVYNLQRVLIAAAARYVEALDRFDSDLRSEVMRNTPYMDQFMVERVHSQIDKLAAVVSGGSISDENYSLEHFQDAIRQRFTQMPNHTLFSGGRTLFGLPEELSDDQLLIFATVVINFNSMVDTLAELGDLIPLLDPQNNRHRRPAGSFTEAGV